MNLTIKKYTKNIDGKDYVVGDIHGSFRQLMQILLKMDFDFKRDRLFSVGDLCDRGPNSNEIIKWMEYEWFIPVMGNHENLILNYCKKIVKIETLIRVGANWWFETNKEEQLKIIDYFEELPIALEVETEKGKVGIVHAVCPTNSWEEFKVVLMSEDRCKYANKAMWTYAKEEEKRRIKDIDYVIVGHTIQNEYKQLENTLLIDTGATFADGYFTILDLQTLKPVDHKNIKLV